MGLRLHRSGQVSGTSDRPAGTDDSRCVTAWYLVYTKGNQERVARENLERQGYSTYLPLMTIRRRRSGKMATRAAPMFPRYLFIQLSEGTDDWGPIRSTVGVANLVRFAERAARIPDDLIVALRRSEDEEGLHQAPSRSVWPGDRVRIEEGVFAGYEAIFQAKSGQDRVLLLLEIAGNSVRLQLKEREIGRATD